MLKDTENDLELGEMDNKSESQPLIYNIFEDDKRLIQDLIAAYTHNDRTNFFEVLSKFQSNDFVYGDNCMKTILYELLLKSPRDDAFFSNFKEVFTINADNYEVLLNTLLTSNFYSNFQKIVDANQDNSQCSELIDQHISTLLDVTSLEEISFSNIRNVRNLNVAENLLKYFLDFKKFQMDQNKNFTENERDPIFLQLVTTILAGKSTENFQQKFHKYLIDKSEEFAENLDVYLEADFSVLIQTAFLQKYKPAIETIVKCELVNINELRIRLEKRENFAELVAECGYFAVLQILLNRKLNNLEEIYSKCLKGNQQEKSDSGDFYDIDHRICLQFLLNNNNFLEIVDHQNPMKEAIRYQDETAVSQLIETFGLKSKFLEEIPNKEFLEKYLDGCIKKVSDPEDKNCISIDYQFLQKSRESCGFDTLDKLISIPEMEDLVTHPVLSLYVIVNFKRFLNLNILKMLLFILVFLGGIFLGYYTQHCLGFFIAGIYLMIIEIFKYNMNCWNINPRVVTSNHQNHSGATEKTKISTRTPFQAFSAIKCDPIEAILIACAIGTGLCFRFNLSIKFFLMVVLIILSAIKLSLILIQVKCNFAIYIHMLKTVTLTFFKISTIILIYILAFGFSFHVIFRHMPMEMRSYSDDSNSNKLDKFESLWVTFIKTIVMMTGEFEASNLDLRLWTDYILLLSFVLTAILLYNFINALAITDVEKLKEKAELQDLKLKISTIKSLQTLFDPFYENQSMGSMKTVMRKLVPGPFKIQQIFIKGKFIEFSTSNQTTTQIQLPDIFYKNLKDILRNRAIEEAKKCCFKKLEIIQTKISQRATSHTSQESLNSKLETMDSQIISNLNCLSAQITTKSDIFNLEFQILKSELNVVRQEISAMKNNVDIMRISLQTFLDRQNKK